RNLSQHNILVPMDYNDYRDSHTQHILSAKDAPYLLYTLPEAKKQIQEFLKEMAISCEDKTTLEHLPYIKDFVLFYILNKNVHDREASKVIEDLILAFTSNIDRATALLIYRSIAISTSLKRLLITLDDADFVKEETLNLIKLFLREASIQMYS